MTSLSFDVVVLSGAFVSPEEFPKSLQRKSEFPWEESKNSSEESNETSEESNDKSEEISRSSLKNKKSPRKKLQILPQGFGGWLLAFAN